MLRDKGVARRVRERSETDLDEHRPRVGIVFGLIECVHIHVNDTLVQQGGSAGDAAVFRDSPAKHGARGQRIGIHVEEICIATKLGQDLAPITRLLHERGHALDHIVLWRHKVCSQHGAELGGAEAKQGHQKRGRLLIGQRCGGIV